VHLLDGRRERLLDGQWSQWRALMMTNEGSKAARRVFLVDDHPVVRDGMGQIIDDEQDLSVCGVASGLAEAMEAMAEQRPDVAVVDIMLNGENGLDLIRQLKGKPGECPILILSMHDERYYAQRALKAGARGYLMKQEPSSVVIDAIRTVLRGKVHVSKSLQGLIMRQYFDGPRKEGKSGIDVLSDRELQVLEMTGRGMKLGEVAATLGIGPKTVETHRLRIRRKLEFENQVALLNFAIRWVEGIES
jgi:DNA-binding NarL/FixJ family response regulator